MSALPPDSIASALQASVQQGNANQIRASEDRRQADISDVIARAVERRENEVDDADMHVNEEGTGTGSQGRAFSEPESGSDQEQDSSGITTDEDGQTHLDITA